MALITGVAFLVVYRFGELGVALRIAAGYGAGAALAGAGRVLARRQRVLGDVVFGGGLAVAYFVTYALHFVPAVRVVESDAVAIALLAAAIAAVVGVAHRMRSETVAGVALFLGLHSGMLSDVSALTLVATCLLAAGAVFFLAANRWVVVPASGLAAAYATHARWELAGSDGGSHALGLAFLWVYFALFAGAVLLRPGALAARARVLLPWRTPAGSWRSARGSCAAPRTDLASFLFAVAAAHVLLAAAAHARDAGQRDLFDAELGTALAAAGLSAWASFDGAPFGAAIAAIAIVIGALARPAAAAGWESGILGGFAAVAAFALVRLASALAPDGLETLSWALAGALLFGAGFAARARRHRVAGFATFVLAGARLLAVDLRRLGPDLRIATFLALGVLLLAVSFAYARARGAGERP